MSGWLDVWMSVCRLAELSPPPPRPPTTEASGPYSSQLPCLVGLRGSITQTTRTLMGRSYPSLLKSSILGPQGPSIHHGSSSGRRAPWSPLAPRANRNRENRRFPHTRPLGLRIRGLAFARLRVRPRSPSTAPDFRLPRPRKSPTCLLVLEKNVRAVAAACVMPDCCLGRLYQRQWGLSGNVQANVCPVTFNSFSPVRSQTVKHLWHSSLLQTRRRT
jgi:hypothetical protein